MRNEFVGRSRRYSSIKLHSPMGTMRNQWDPVLGRRAIQVDQQRARRPCPRCWRLRLSSPDFPGLPTFPHPRLLQTPGTPASAELSRARVQLIYLRRTAYVRVYVAVCLAVFFLSPHFSKERDPGDTGNGLTYYMLAARREKAPSSPAHSLPLCSAPLASG